MEYLVDFKADTDRMLTIPGILIATITLVLFFLSGFNLFALLFGCAFYMLAVISFFIYTSITFPVYFIGLRNDIEKQINTYRSNF